MLNLSEKNVHLSAQAENKQEVISLAANALEQAGYVESGYLAGMLERETQTSTYLGNGIAIPHGTVATRSMVKNTGVQIFQFPQGIEWGEGNKAYIVIAIAARSDEHLSLLRRLTHVLADEEAAKKLVETRDFTEFKAILTGKSRDESIINSETINLNIDTKSLLTLTAINAGELQKQSAVDNTFISEVISTPALPLGQGLWITDALVGNKKNAIAFSRASAEFTHNGKKVQGVLTVSAINDQINQKLTYLLKPEVQQILLSGTCDQILTAFGILSTNSTQENHSNKTEHSSVQSNNTPSVGSVIGLFTIRNEHGLHARPTALLINEAKKFNANITVENISRNTAPVNAKSLIKIVGLGATQGHRLRFVAEGDDAMAAIKAIGQSIAAGLGETPSMTSLLEEDSIEEVSTTVAPVAEEITGNSVEGVFVITNEHGLHARPATALVNEVKKYHSSIAVQNLDRLNPLVSAKSLMKIVALGAVKGHRLRFVASGEDAQEAIEGIGNVIESGLGE